MTTLATAISRRYPETPQNRKSVILDDIKLRRISPEDAQLLAQAFPAAEALALNHTGLTTLVNFPPMPKLTRLELQDNQLRDSDNGLDEVAAAAPNLRHLRLGGNKLKDVDVLIGKLRKFHSLESITVEVNEFDSDVGTRLFAALPRLSRVNSATRDGKAVGDGSESDEEEDDDDEDDEEGEGELEAFYKGSFDEDDPEDADFDPEAAAAAGGGGEGDHDIDDDDDDEDDEDEDDEKTAGEGPLAAGGAPQCPGATRDDAQSG